MLIPVRRNMDIYEDMVLFQQPDVTWVCLEEPVAEVKETPRPKPKAIVKREKKRQETHQTTRVVTTAGGNHRKEGGCEYRRVSELVFLHSTAQCCGQP